MYDNGQARTASFALVRALESFIAPLLQGHGACVNPGISNDMANQSNSDLSPEAGHLLNALRQFIVSIPCTPAVDDDSLDVEAESSYGFVDKGRTKITGEFHFDFPSYIVCCWLPEQLRNSRIRSCLISWPKARCGCPRLDVDEEDKRLLRLVTEKIHHKVFNDMPIRLLKFSSSGEGMELVERSEIYRSISSHVADTFDKAKITKITSSMPSRRSNKEELAIEHKVRNFCRVAATEHNVTLGWMDTICINKESSSELDESIRSMYKWYQHAKVCIAYLGDTLSLERMHSDTWFTRGWTLQELIAPRNLKFYNSNWARIAAETGNDKANRRILTEVRRATTITAAELDAPVRGIPISRRMHWAAHRRVTREEDTAYSLMGIFNVSISIAYGEGGERAFVRLVRELLSTGVGDVLDIVNWGYGPHPSSHAQKVDISSTSGLIPTNPKPYAWRAAETVSWGRSVSPVTLTQVGLCVPVLMMPGRMTDASTAAAPFDPRGSYSAKARCADVSRHGGEAVEYSYNVLDRAIFQQAGRWRVGGSDRSSMIVRVFGVLNITETPSVVQLPLDGVCFAVLLTLYPSPVNWTTTEEFTDIVKHPTERPVTFNLRQHVQQ